MPDPAGLRARRFPPSQLVTAACDCIVSDHAGRLPDLTSIVVLAPNLHARQRIARALRRSANVPVLLLPRITTLRSWAEEVAVDRPVQSGVAREVLLYQALSAKRWFSQADLWAIAAELSGLFDELTRWHVGMPASAADFRRLLERAYRARAGASFAFEARMVFELWHAFAGSSDKLDPESAHQVRLGRLEDASVQALYAIDIDVDRLPPSERDFVRRCAQRVPVTCFEAGGEPDEGFSAVDHVLAHAWPKVVGVPVARRAAELRERFATPVLAGRLSFCGVRGIEQEARAIELAVRRWLHAGLERIAVVVLDRLTARRARALLERAQVLVRDEVGWAFSTTSASTVVSRWFDVCSNDFYHRDLLDFLKSPFVLPGWARERRQQAVWLLESEVRRHSVRADLERYLVLAESTGDEDLRAMLHAVRAAARSFEVRKRRPAGAWLRALHAALEAVGVVDGLAADAAGQQLLTLLRALESDLAAHGMHLGFGEFRRWLGRCLESATFRDVGIESPVVFTALSATRLREFDAVLVAGADTVNLSGMPAQGLFFNQAVRRELGLPGALESIRGTEADLASLIACTPQVCVTWQQVRDGEANLLAPVLERLRTLHRLAWNHDLEAADLAASARRPSVDEREAGAVRRCAPPAPIVAADAVPMAISASAYNALMACPYRFYAQHLLGLKEVEDVQEEVDKSDYGNLVHEVLRRFHVECPEVSKLDAAEARERLLRISGAVFSEAMTNDYLARAWLLRWEKLLPGYLDWQRGREAAGWRFRAAEVERRVCVLTPAGRRFELLGRIDRIDERIDERIDDRDAAAVCVVDYKAQSAASLQQKLRTPGEDVQLPVYGVLWDAPVGEAMFLSLDRDEIRPVPLDADLGALTDEVRDRLGVLLDGICDGAPLPAQGSESDCAHCRFQGLCRRKHWS